jgi:acylphosphatase
VVVTRCRRFLVSGRVQGVFYRAATEERARALGLGGWVRNLPDGRVELIACGDAHGLAALEAWLWRGPPSARVESVNSEDVAAQTFNGFGVRY